MTDSAFVGRVISLDRIYPLVKSSAGEFRVQHSVDFVKNSELRAVVGDLVEIESPPGQDTPLITAIRPRGHSLVRRSLVESLSEGAGKYDEQILATNIDIVLVMVALSNRCLDLDYLERQLVMAHESGAEVAIILSKADQSKRLDKDILAAREIAFNSLVIAESAVTGEGLNQVYDLVRGGRIGVLLGRSGVGKSTLINRLVGRDLLETNPVRSKDRAGRHTTVARRMVFLDCTTMPVSSDSSDSGLPISAAPNLPLSSTTKPSVSTLSNLPISALPGSPALDLPKYTSDHYSIASLGSAIIDTPGLRSIGVYNAHLGLATTFPDMRELAASCRYRDCTHTSEPGCAVIEAVKSGKISERRLNSYRGIAAEVRD